MPKTNPCRGGAPSSAPGRGRPATAGTITKRQANHLRSQRDEATKRADACALELGRVNTEREKLREVLRNMLDDHEITGCKGCELTRSAQAALAD